MDALQAVQQEEMNQLFLQDEIASLLSKPLNQIQSQDLQYYINLLSANVDRRNEVVNRVNAFLEEQQNLISNRKELLDQLLELQSSISSVRIQN